MANEKVVNLFSSEPVPALNEVNESLVSVLKRALELAESGSLQSFIGTGWTNDGFRFSVYDHSKHTNFYEMLGALEFLKDKYKERMQDDNI